ncbi:putative membrane protein [Bacillus fengqiuensis]|nr:putative membrane protein [Bacillus fengqiuensis]
MSIYRVISFVLNTLLVSIRLYFLIILLVFLGIKIGTILGFNHFVHYLKDSVMPNLLWYIDDYKSLRPLMDDLQ